MEVHVLNGAAVYAALRLGDYLIDLRRVMPHLFRKRHGLNEARDLPNVCVPVVIVVLRALTLLFAVNSHSDVRAGYAALGVGRGAYNCLAVKHPVHLRKELLFLGV